MTKFKVGDVVIVNKDEVNYAGVWKGDRLTVIAVSHNHDGSVESYTTRSDNGVSWSIEEKYLDAPTALGVNPKDLLGIKKVQLNLVPPSSMIYQALAMEDGARKYGPFNWRENKVIASIYIAAAMRHLHQWLDGEELTSDSKVPNLGAALACLGIIVDAKESGNLVDDRPKPGPASRLVDELAAKKFASTSTQVNEATEKKE